MIEIIYSVKSENKWKNVRWVQITLPMSKSTKDKSRSKSQKYKEIVNPIFLKLSSFTLDTFWQDTLNSYAHGKFPRGLSYKNDSLMYRKKSSIVRCDVDEENPEQAFTALMDFMRNTVKILSPLDNQLKEQEIGKLKFLESLSNKKSWSQIKKLKLKQHLIDEFIDDTAEKYALNTKEKRHLTFEVNMGILFKTINSKTIVIKDSKIKKIIGLKYEENAEPNKDKGIKKIFSIERKHKKKIAITKTKKKVTSMWKNYMKQLQLMIQTGKKLAK